MRFIIPRVHVGDVLFGTRNLRNYLRTASLLMYAEDVASGGKPSRRYKKRSFSQSVHTPTKNDRYVVLSNANKIFAVWGLNGDLLIVFNNPSEKQNGPMAGLSYGAETMTPEIFSRWFIRSRGKMPDLRSWPAWAYHVWAAAHMNARSNIERCLMFNPVAGGMPHHSPFVGRFMGMPRDIDRVLVRDAAREAIITGIFRQDPPARTINGGRPFGPSLREIDRMQEQLKKLLKQPQIRKRIKDKYGQSFENDFLVYYGMPAQQ